MDQPTHTPPEGAAMFAKAGCPHCDRAEALLESLGATVSKIMVDRNPDEFARMRAWSQDRRTVPQIFLDGTWVGGCDDLHALAATDPELLNALIARSARSR